MNLSFWSHCQGIVRRLKQPRRAKPRLVPRLTWAVETLEARALLSSTPAMVVDINLGSNSSNPQNLVAIGSTTYFTAYDNVHGQELWKSDGTAAGTMLVKEIAPGANQGGTSSRIGNLTAANGTLYFAADDGVHGMELWRSDGTTAGTFMVADINPGSASSYAGARMNINGTLYFSANDGVHGFELWKSDGTAAGTTMVKNIALGGGALYDQYYARSSSPGNMTNVNGTLFFTLGAGSVTQLWKSDGTSTGTVPVSSNYFQTGANQLIDVNGTLYFTANDWSHGWELWKSNGTAAGTTLVKDIYPGETTQYRYYGYSGSWVTIPNSSFPSALTVRNGTLFFTANDGAHGTELWKSDGTEAGTLLVTDAEGAVSSGPDGLENVNGTLYFARGNSIWKSDGTAAGSSQVKVIAGSNLQFGSPRELTNVNGTLYFVASDSDHGPELWKSDGTANGTTLVADILPGSYAGYYGSYFPKYLTNANGTLFFTANDVVHGAELWAINTTAPPVATSTLSVSGFPVTTTAGTAGSFTVTVKNADGTTNTDYLGKVHFTSSDPQAVLPADYTFTATDKGVHTFSATLKTAGVQSITATDTQGTATTGTAANLAVKAAAASALSVTGLPGSTTAGVANSVTVTLKDPYGNIATGYTGTVKFTSSDTKAALPANYTFTAGDAGNHTFSIVLKTAGTRTITAVDTAKASLTATSGGIAVKAAAASKLLVTGPSSVKRGSRFSVTLSVADAYGNVVTDYTGSVRFTSSDKSASLPANYTFKASDKGVHTFTGVVLRTKGMQKITLADKQINSLTGNMTTKVT